MIYRLTGAILLITAAIVLGLGFREREKRYIRALAQSVDMLRFARRKIDLFNTPCTEIFHDYESGGQSDVTPEKLEKLYGEMGEDADILRAFFKQLGSGYKADTLRLCDHTEAQLEQRLNNAEKEYPARAKLCSAMPLLFAISFIVLIL